MPGRCLSVFFLILLTAPLCRASQVPPDLAPWREWVLHGLEEQLCPPAFNNPGDRRCAWPSALDLDLTGKGGRFRLEVTLFAPAWVALPGRPDLWPEDVMIGDRRGLVALHQGGPAVFLETGENIITGMYSWNRLPESLPVPRENGLLNLTLEGRKIPFPDLRSGLLWLREREGRAESTEDSLQIQVYRRLEDTVPFTVVTRLEIDVAGRQREVLLGPVLPHTPEGKPFVPMRLSSPLTARFEKGGQLRIQVRPGHWRVEVLSRSTGPVEKLEVPSLGQPWPEREIWVFSARTDLRVVQPEGLSPVDPGQTNLAPDWHGLPAFVARPGQELFFNVIRRGDTDPSPNQITLGREMWLDFDGSGYTILDRVTGTMSSSHRLEASPELSLGRVTLSGEDMLITRLPDSDRPGVEVRRGDLELSAASRMEGDVKHFYASGWEHELLSARTLVHIPPGWEIIGVTGIDNRPRTWLGKWTLLDLFLVLVISIAAFRMLSPGTGILALAALTLTWHAPFAPASIWLHILAAMALVRYLPEGKLKKMSSWYRMAALGVLILLFIPFAVHQIRTALYPQLELQSRFLIPGGRPADTVGEDFWGSGQSTLPEMKPQVVTSLSEGRIPAPTVAGKGLPQENAGLYRYPESALWRQMDKEALVQTGPGLPSWKWNAVSLQFNGPVTPDQRVRIYYLSPFATSVVRIAGVLLAALLGLVFAGVRLSVPGRAAAGAILLAAFLLPGSALAEAAPFPPADLLQEYQERLLEPPDCMPDCAQVSRMRLQATPDALRLLLEIHALADVGVPLPGLEGQWLPGNVRINGLAPVDLSRDGNGQMWIFLARGVHQVVLDGDLPDRGTVQIPLPLPVHSVAATVEGWVLEGIHENGLPDRQLQLTRIRKEMAGAAGGPGTGLTETLPPFVLIERNLTLGLEWRSRTVVRRMSAPDAAIVLEVPLLEGESVITEGIRVQDGKVLVNMAPEQQTLSWEGTLPTVEELILRSPATDRWVESWQAEASPVWHMEQVGGIPVVARQDPRGVWAPQWRPWPGEEVRLSITRPTGIPGNTLTIDQSSYSLTPGKNATQAVLTFTARSSLGGQHAIGLPPEAELSGLRIDGLMQPIRPEEGRLILPVRPGTQDFEITCRLPEGIGAFFSSPRADLGQESVNQRVKVTMPRSRWILLTGGPRLGPAVLFWSILVVILLAAAGLARTGLTPLRWWQWALLGLGLTQVTVPAAAVIAGWLLVLGIRSRTPEDMEARRFDAMQAGLALLTLLAAIALVGAIKKGLLGYPEMQVMGNGSTAYSLLWYADRAAGLTSRVWVLSVPMFFYRLLMLAWALWLAYSLTGWVKWGWGSFTKGGYWKKFGPIGLIKK